MRATATFNRNRTRVRRGDVFKVESQAHMRDYQSRGLAVLVREAPTPSNKMAPEPANKGPSQAGGAAQPSSASPPARRSRRTTANASGAGKDQAGT